MKRIPLVILLAVACLPATLAGQTTQPDTWDTEQYYTTTMNGRRVGYFCMRQRELPGGGFESFNGLNLTMKVNERSVRTVIVLRYTESADGVPLRARTMHQTGLTPIHREVEIRDGRQHQVYRQGGRVIESTLDWDKRVLFDVARRRELKKRLASDGQTASVWTWEPGMGQTGIYRLDYRRVGTEQIEVAGRQVQAIHLVAASDAIPGAQHEWVDADFRLVATELASGPKMTIRMEACSKAFAHQRFDAPEMFRSSLIPLTGKTDALADADAFRLTLEFTEPLEHPLKLPETRRQKVVDSTDQRLVVDLSRPDWPKAGQAAQLPDDVRPFLEASEVFDINDDAVRVAARQAVGDADEPLARARKLRDWVRGHLTRKELGVAAGTASEVLRARRGDCTEHSVLLVALARASGIPARTVHGLVAVRMGKDRSWVLSFHQWTQLYVRGEWVQFDAALPGVPATAGRIALSLGGASGNLSDGAQPQIFMLFGNVRQARIEQLPRR